MKKLFFAVFALLAFTSVDAQQLDGIQRGTRGYTPPPRQFNYNTTYSLKDPVEETNKIITICTEKFALDDFEKEILKGLVMRKIEDENAIVKNEDYDGIQRRKEYLKLENSFYAELGSMGIMSKEEIDQMKLINFDENARQKKKKDKKKRKNSKN